jgi:serpin B
MKKFILILLAGILMAALIGCSQSVQASELKSDKPRDTSPAISQTELNKLVEGNSAFAFNLYQLLKKQDGNLFYSPYSISEALAMTYAGARSETEQQMASSMQYLLDQKLLHAGFNALDLELAKRGQGAKGTDEKGFRLNVVNAIWGQQDFKFTSEFLDVLAQNYGAGLRILDFKKSPEPSRQTINQWVSDQTEARIKDLLPKGSIDSLTRLVLTNAIYFNAAWQSQFHKESTSNGDFTLINGSKVNVPLMFQSKSYKYAAGPDYQAVELPYDGRELSMVVLLPASGRFTDFESSLSGAQIAQIVQSLQSNQVDLTLPKFKIESDLDLNDTLKALGMTDAFNAAKADFSGMDGAKDLYITSVVHKSWVTVDEAGTEAAAATGVVVGTTSMPLDIKEMKIDRPFIFLIRDIQTGAILFVGRVMNPA